MCHTFMTFVPTFEEAKVNLADYNWEKLKVDFLENCICSCHGIYCDGVDIFLYEYAQFGAVS